MSAKESKLGGEGGDHGTMEWKTDDELDPRSRAIRKGFRIDMMSMSDGETKEELWREASWGEDMFLTEKRAHLPRRLLDCRVVSRTLVFSSAETMRAFRIEQRFLLHGHCVERWDFPFGFVIPGSCNEWQQTIVAAEKSQMLSAEQMSGHLVVLTVFYDGDFIVGRTRVRIFYDADSNSGGGGGSRE